MVCAGRVDRLLTPGLLVRAYLFLGLLEAAAAMAAFFFVLTPAGWHWGQELSTTDRRQWSRNSMINVTMTGTGCPVTSLPGMNRHARAALIAS